MTHLETIGLLLFAGSVAHGAACAQAVTVSGRCVLEGAGKHLRRHQLWCGWRRSALPPPPSRSDARRAGAEEQEICSASAGVTRGSSVEFPNRDPWFHNVFSLFNGKRFDLGLYEAGSTRTVHFDREGISFIFCNIHPEMSAVIVVLRTPISPSPTSRAHFPSPRFLPVDTCCMCGTKEHCRHLAGAVSRGADRRQLSFTWYLACTLPHLRRLPTRINTARTMSRHHRTTVYMQP